MLKKILLVTSLAGLFMVNASDAYNFSVQNNSGCNLYVSAPGLTWDKSNVAPNQSLYTTINTTGQISVNTSDANCKQNQMFNLQYDDANHGSGLLTNNSSGVSAEMAVVGYCTTVPVSGHTCKANAILYNSTSTQNHVFVETDQGDSLGVIVTPGSPQSSKNPGKLTSEQKSMLKKLMAH